MNYLETLNNEQREAVLSDFMPIAIIASAGSGKTKTLTSRIQYMLDNDVSPNSIWACTFTKKAAENMKERLISNGCDKYAVNRLRIGTLHSLSYWVLRQFYKNYHPHVKLNIIKDNVTWLFFTNLIKNNDLATKDVKTLISFISKQKLDLFSVEETLELIKPLVEGKFNEKISFEYALYFAYREYQKYLNQNNYIDFSDMLYKTWKILSNDKYSAFNNKISAQVGHLLVDEFQDTNLVSYELYKLLAKETRSVFIVGDSRQAIYSFQGSSHKYFDKFFEDYNPKKIELVTNYRSSKTIVENSNVFMNTLGLSNVSHAITPNEAGQPIEVMYSIDEMEESTNLTNLILDIVNSGDFSYGDIAVLYRVNAQAIPIMDSLLSRQIPHVVFSKGGYFKRREVRQVVTYLKALNDPYSLNINDIKLIMNAPIRYITNATIDMVSCLDGDFLIDKISRVDQLDIKKFQRDTISSFRSQIMKGHSLLKQNKFENTQEAILYILNTIGLGEYFNSSDNADDSVDADEDKSLNIDVLMSISERYTHIDEFILHAESMQSKNSEDENTKDKVKLMTMHSSKGMEFPVVIIAGFCSRFHPLYRASSNDDYNEERRVAYVGITRAEKKMYISTIYQNYSRFKVSPSYYAEDMGLINKR